MMLPNRGLSRLSHMLPAAVAQRAALACWLRDCWAPAPAARVRGRPWEDVGGQNAAGSHLSMTRDHLPQVLRSADSPVGEADALANLIDAAQSKKKIRGT